MPDFNKNEKQDGQLAEVFKKYKNIENDEDRLKKVAEEIDAVEGDTYVKLDYGIMTVNQINAFLKSFTQEITFTDSDNQFIYFNNDHEKMLAERTPSQVGHNIAENHQESSAENVNKVLDMVKSGQLDNLSIPTGSDKKGQYIIHQYYSVREDDGTYLGVRETVKDLQPLIDWYLEKTEQTLSGGKEDAISSATSQDEK